MPSSSPERFADSERAGARTALPWVAAALVALVALLALGHELEAHLQAVEAWIAGLGPWGVLAFVGLFVVGTSLLVPDSLLCLLAGALFGLTRGAVIVVGGSLLACPLQYVLARRLARAPIERLLAARPSWAAIRRAVLRDELRLQVLLRMAPVNPATLSYLLGAAGVRFAGFVLACLAMAPNLVLEVYLGHAGRHLVRRRAGGVSTDRLHDLALLGGGVVAIVVLVLVARATRRALARAVDAAEGS